MFAAFFRTVKISLLFNSLPFLCVFSNGIDTIKNRYIANERKKKKKSITKSAPINGFHFTWKMMMFNMVILAFTSLAFALFPLIFPLLLFYFDLVWKNARNPFWAVQRTLALSLSWSVSCLSDRKLQLFHFIFFLLHFISFSLCFFLCFAVTYAVVYRLMIRFVVVVVFFSFHSSLTSISISYQNLFI